MKFKLLKYFIIVFLVSFLIINWNDISWIFNYKFISQAVFYSIEEDKLNYTDKENSLEIPKIEISAPLIIRESLNQADLEKELKKGVVFFPDSVLPGERGQTIILGHSAISQWPKTNYIGVFSELNELDKGDQVFVYFNHQKYTYYVKEKTFLDGGEEIPQNDLTNSENILILISCWPPGRTAKRIAVEAELKI